MKAAPSLVLAIANKQNVYTYIQISGTAKVYYNLVIGPYELEAIIQSISVNQPVEISYDLLGNHLYITSIDIKSLINSK